MLITMSNGVLKGYWYQEGYIRTSSEYFDLDELDDPMIHLTNDAVQKHGDEYGVFEPGNKLTYNDLQRYLDSMGSKVDFFKTVYPEMRVIIKLMQRIATECVASTSLFLDPEKRENNFEVFGLDFMVDSDFKVWLIEVNTNPCLELSCGIL
jgi:tubulin polyglutamylase TTLL1